MLQNISHVSNKEELLKQTFLTCPFCIELYEKCVDLSLMNDEMLKTVQYFGFDEALCVKIEDYCKQNLENENKIEELVNILSSYKDVSNTQIMRSLYKDKLNRILREYRDFILAIEDKHSLDLWIRNNISTKIAQVVVTPFEKIRATRSNERDQSHP